MEISDYTFMKISTTSVSSLYTLKIVILIVNRHGDLNDKSLLPK